ncbi:MAG: PEP-CTERM sorting domain-containing protein [Chthoniobacterales bacterium]
MKNKAPLSLGLLLAFVFVLAGSNIHAQIVWLTPQAISADSNVSSLGSTVDALKAWTGGSAVTVNGVTFNPMTLTAGSYSDGTGSIVIGSPLNNTAFSHGNPVSGASGAYNTLLGTFSYSNAANTITFNNLIAGHEYQVQVWVSQTTTPANGLNLDGSNPVSLTGYVTSASNGTFATGTFTATSTSFVENTKNSTAYSGSSVNLNGTAYPYGSAILNAVQIRDITAVPEPSSVALISVVALGFGAWRTRKAIRG